MRKGELGREPTSRTAAREGPPLGTVEQAARAPAQHSAVQASATARRGVR